MSIRYLASALKNLAQDPNARAAFIEDASTWATSNGLTGDSLTQFMNDAPRIKESLDKFDLWAYQAAISLYACRPVYQGTNQASTPVVSLAWHGDGDAMQQSVLTALTQNSSTITAASINSLRDATTAGILAEATALLQNY